MTSSTNDDLPVALRNEGKKGEPVWVLDYSGLVELMRSCYKQFRSIARQSAAQAASWGDKIDAARGTLQENIELIEAGADDPTLLDSTTKLEWVIAESEENLARTIDLGHRAEQAAADLAYIATGMVGRLIASATRQRDRLRDQAGLVQLDADLDGLRQRYQALYRPMFETPGEAPHTDPPVTAGWTLEEWQAYEVDLVLPVMFYNKVQCSEYWPYDDIPPCHGPDMDTAWSLQNQLGQARAHQLTLLDTVFGWLDDILTGLGQGLKGVLARTWDSLAAPVRAARRWVRAQISSLKAKAKPFLTGGLVLAGFAAIAFMSGGKGAKTG